MKQLAESDMQSCIVTCNMTENVNRESYPNLSKNTIKIKYSLVFFILFISVVSWLALLLFERLTWLHYWFSHW